jgi:O-antigen/teichoic acid export membrane protein
MVSTKQLFGAISSGALGVLLKNGLTFFLMPIVIQHLGVSAYGLYVLLMNLTELPQSVGFGFGNGLSRQLAVAHETQQAALAKDYIHSSHWLYLAFVVGLVIVASLCGAFFTEFFHIQVADYTGFDWIYGAALAEGSIRLYSSRLMAILEAHGETQWNYLADSLANVLAISLGIIAVLVGGGLVGLMICRLAAVLVQWVMLGLKSQQCEPDRYPLWHPLHWQRCRELVNVSTQFLMSQFGIVVSHGLDGFVVGHFLSLYWVGTYSFVFRLMAVATRMTASGCQILFPMMSRLFAQNNLADSRALFLRASRWAFFANGAMLVTLMVTFPLIFALTVQGEIRYSDTTWLRWIGFSSALLTAFIFPVAHYLNSHGYARFAMISSLCTSASNLACSIALVGPMGAVGVALGTLIPQCVEYMGFMIPKSLGALQTSAKQYLTEVVGPAVLPLTLLGGSLLSIGLLLSHFSSISTWAQLTLCGTVAIILTLLMAYGWICQPAERVWVVNQANRRGLAWPGGKPK